MGWYIYQVIIIRHDSTLVLVVVLLSPHGPNIHILLYLPSPLSPPLIFLAPLPHFSFLSLPTILSNGVFVRALARMWVCLWGGRRRRIWMMRYASEERCWAMTGGMIQIVWAWMQLERCLEDNFRTRPMHIISMYRCISRVTNTRVVVKISTYSLVWLCPLA